MEKFADHAEGDAAENQGLVFGGGHLSAVVTFVTSFGSSAFNPVHRSSYD